MDRLLKPTLVIAAACCMACILTLARSKTFAAENDTILIQDVKITPSTLNMKSKGKFITAHVNLPVEYRDELPPPENVKLHMVIQDNDTGEVVARRTGWDYFDRLLVTFSRSEVQALIADTIDQFPATVTLSITIDVDNETLVGTDDIRAIKPGNKGKGGKGGGNGYK
jgi:hypothetical protein